MRILLAEDEVLLSKAIVKILEKNKFSVDAVYNGLEALDYLEYGNYDVLILDIMMPVKNGIEVLKELRQNHNPIPVLILSAKSQVSDRVLGLDSGANYYLTKPFETSELLATIRAITRKDGVINNEVTFGDVTLNCATYELSTSKGTLRLANKEFQMMEMLLKNPNNVISTEKFMEKIWGYDSEAEINIVWVYISYLRKKLVALQSSVKIVAHRNLGYSIEV